MYNPPLHRKDMRYHHIKIGDERIHPYMKGFRMIILLTAALVIGSLLLVIGLSIPKDPKESVPGKLMEHRLEHQYEVQDIQQTAEDIQTLTK